VVAALDLHEVRDEDALLAALTALTSEVARGYTVLFRARSGFVVYASTERRWAVNAAVSLSARRADEVWLPMVSGGRDLGALVLHGASGEPPAELGRHVASALFHLQSAAELRRRVAFMGAQLSTFRATRSLLGQLDLDGLLTKLQELAVRMLASEVGCVLVRGGGGLSIAVNWGLDRPSLDAIRVGGLPVVERLLVTGEVQRVGPGAARARVRSALLIPITSRDGVEGALALVNRLGGDFTDDDVETGLTIAGIAGGALRSSRLHRTELERRELRASLQLAGDIQRRLMPEDCPAASGCAMAGWSRPADESGGDFYDFFPDVDGRAALCVGDVSGHGITAALPMATARAFIRAWQDRLGEPGAVMAALNRLLLHDLDAHDFVTLFLAVYDPRTRSLTYASAGHEPALLLRTRANTVEALEATGVPLGMFPGQVYETQTLMDLEPGDVLLASTDGITEQANPDGELFGGARLKGALRASVGALSARLTYIDGQLQAFRRGAPILDDHTLSALRARERKAPEG